MQGRRTPIILWFRRDLRMSDHAALHAAAETGRPVIPVFILDDLGQGLGAAPKWRLGQGLDVFSRMLERIGGRLILRKGDALTSLGSLISETGATSVYWSRAYDPEAVARDTKVKSALSDRGVEARSFAGHLLFEPWSVANASGQPFRVFTPMWRAVQGRQVPAPLPAVRHLNAPTQWPRSDSLTDWHLGAAMRRGAAVVSQHVAAGEDAAQSVLDGFLDRLTGYPVNRDRLDMDGTSSLSEYLSLGEISPRTVWHRVKQIELLGAAGSEEYLRQLVWREFAYHLAYHTPQLVQSNWKADWDAFPWNTDDRHPDVMAWKQARTGIPAVDAGLRQMYVTGRMHNRARMIVASYLTKHLMTHWKIGMDWFADCLVDWDPAANAMGWQWVAGSGPDAAPFFRIFNPEVQREKFDPDATYVSRWIAETQTRPGPMAESYFSAIPLSWNLSPQSAYPQPVVDLATGRARALAAYAGQKDQ